MTVIIIILAMVIVVGVILHYRSKQRQLIGKLEKMMDLAECGSAEMGEIDESMFSSMENRFYHLLYHSQTSTSYLAEQKNQIQSLISDISHQIVTPISNIRLFTELLREKDTGKEFNEELGAIEEQTEKLSFLIDMMVKTSRLENGILTVHPRRNPIQPLIEMAVQQCKLKADDKHIRINMENTSEEAVYDPKWTVEAIHNIIDNGIKYTAEGGAIAINIQPYQLFLRIDIEDTGIGIAEQELPRIFQRFYRSSDVIDDEGLGIGLYLAREIIVSQHGYIKVSSRKGQGSVFSIFLPREIYQN